MNRELIAELERATGPRPELDRAIHLEMWTAFALPEPPAYTENVAGALLLKPDNFTWAAGDCNEDNVPWACLTGPDGTDYAATAATEPIAICIAALHAKAA